MDTRYLADILARTTFALIRDVHFRLVSRPAASGRPPPCPLTPRLDRPALTKSDRFVRSRRAVTRSVTGNKRGRATRG
jgi:hypothetical protein